MLALSWQVGRAEVPVDPPGSYTTTWLGNSYMDAQGHKNVTEDQFPREGERVFTPPGEPGVGNDWVLALDDPQRELGAPRVVLEPFDWRGFGGFDTYKWRGFLLCTNRWGGGNGRIWLKDHGDTLPRLRQMHCVNLQTELRSELARHWDFAAHLTRSTGEPPLPRRHSDSGLKLDLYRQ